MQKLQFMRSSSFATKFWVIWSKKRVSHSLTKKMKRFSIKNFWFLKPIKMKNFCHPLLSYLERRIAGERNLAGFCGRCFTWSFLSIFSTILIQESYVKKEKKVELWSVGPRLAVRSRSLHRKDILVKKKVKRFDFRTFLIERNWGLRQDWNSNCQNITQLWRPLDSTYNLEKVYLMRFRIKSMLKQWSVLHKKETHIIFVVRHT